MMVLFGRKKEEKKALACACSAAYSACETVEIASDCCAQTQEGIYCIKVLGSGCASCHAQYENAKKAVEKLKLPVEVEYITDLQQVMQSTRYRLVFSFSRYLCQHSASIWTNGAGCL